LYRQRGGLPNKITNGIDMRNPELMSVEKTKRNLVKAITELESAWGGSSGDLQRCIAAPTQCGDVDAEEVEALRAAVERVASSGRNATLRTYDLNWYTVKAMDRVCGVPHNASRAHCVAQRAWIEKITAQEAINTPFCPLQEKFHTFVLRGLRNISEAP
jgi:hypothetical protein